MEENYKILDGTTGLATIWIGVKPVEGRIQRCLKREQGPVKCHVNPFFIHENLLNFIK